MRGVVVLEMLARFVGLVQIVLGLLFWAGLALSLVPVHMLLGASLVLILWSLAVIALVARVAGGLAALAVVWGVVVLALGLTQAQLLPGSWHWLVQVVHLLVGLAAIGLTQILAREIRSSRRVRLAV
jgi:hypothetical protein